jgi:hypothetical protein
LTAEERRKITKLALVIVVKLVEALDGEEVGEFKSW